MKRSIKRMMRSVAIASVLSMLICLIPQGAINPFPEANAEASASAGEPGIVREIVGKRTENSKTFLREDGSYLELVSFAPVHYQDEKQEWQDIDNTLSEQTENGQTVIANQAAGYRVEFPTGLSAESTVTMKKDEHALSFRLLEAKGRVKNQLKNPKSARVRKTDSPGELLEFEKKSTAVVYPNVQDGTTIRYDVLSNQLKESIILTKKPGKAVSYTYEVTAEGMLAQLHEDGSVDFVSEDTEESVFHMPAPFMSDSASIPVCSDAVEVALESSGRGIYRLTYTPDPDWLSDADRAYPVTIDPTMEEQSVAALDGTYTPEQMPNYNYYPSMGTWMSADMGNLGRIDTYIKFMGLSRIPENILLNKATLNLYCTDKKTRNYVKVQELTSSVDLATVTYNTKPSVSSVIEDYVPIQTGWNALDVTHSLGRWWSGETVHGFMVQAVGTKDPVYFVSRDATGDNAAYRPYLALTYQPMIGYDETVDHHTVDMGRAGTASIDDVRGFLTVRRDDLSIDGNRMPVEYGMDYLGLVETWSRRYSHTLYRSPSYWGYELRTDDYHFVAFELGTDNANGSRENYGWVRYPDRDGLGYDLLLNDNSSIGPRVKTPDGTTLCFNWNQVQVNANIARILPTEQDESSAIVINSTSITDGAGRVYQLPATTGATRTLIYKANGTAALRTVTYTYQGDHLTSVQYPDGKSVSYTYDSEDRLKSVTDVDGRSWTFTYVSASSYRVKTVTSKASDGTVGDTLSIRYALGVTTFTDQNGRMEIKQYDANGKTTGIRDENGNAVYMSYDDKQKNKLMGSSDIQKTVINLLPNPGAEVANGSLYDWAANAALGSGVNSSITNLARSGKYAFSMTRLQGATSTNFWLQTTKTLSEGGSYTLSGYMATSGVLGGDGAGFLVEVYKNGSLQSTRYVQAPDGSSSASADPWQRLTCTFTAEAGSSVKISVGFQGGSGSIRFDDMQLEKGDSASGFNLVMNSDATFGDTSAYRPWTYDNGCSVTGLAQKNMDIPHASKTAFYMQGASTADRTISQLIRLCGKAGDSFTVGGWAKADALPVTDSNGRTFEIQVVAPKSDGTMEVLGEAKFSSFIRDAQFAAAGFTLNRDVEEVYLRLRYDKQMNYAYFDAIQLFRGEFIPQTTQEEDADTHDEYDGKGRVIRSGDEGGTVMAYTYDDFGNPLTADTIRDGERIRDTYTYTASGNYTASHTDPLGNTTTYTYDENLGTLTSMTDPKGTVTTYTYDSLQRMLSASSGGTSISYTYDGDRLTGINAGTAYTFTYDKWGNQNAVKIGSNVLMSQSFDSQNRLKTMAYGGIGRTYEYADSAHPDLVTSIVANELGTHRLFAYDYNEDGVLISRIDDYSGITTKYRDDGTVEEYLTSTNAPLRTCRYDEDGNLVESIGSRSFTTRYLEDASQERNGIAFGSLRSEKRHDGFDRAKGVVFYNGDDPVYKQTFTYRDSMDFGTSQVLDTYKQQYAGGMRSYTYAYDGNGNITHISLDGTLQSRYTYDAQNQLIREDNAAAGETTVYAYDNAGNLTSKTSYPYTTEDTLGTAASSVSYGYGNTAWKDQLTSWNGQTITYSPIGNPIQYRDGFSFL